MSVGLEFEVISHSGIHKLLDVKLIFCYICAP